MSRNTSFPSFAGAALRLAACLLLAAGSRTLALLGVGAHGQKE